MGEESADRRYADRGSTNFAPLPGPRGGDALGRWPANVVLGHGDCTDDECHPECPVRLLDEQTGELGVSRGGSRGAGGQHGRLSPIEAQPDITPGYGDRGGASQFFYVAKPSSSERGAGLGYDGERNQHPTVKPIELMRWLVRLVTPPGGTVLDPFVGSGTTGCAAMLERVDFVGIERDPEYAEIARARIDWWQRHPDGVSLVKRIEAEKQRKEVAESGQLDMFDGLG